MDAAKRPGRNIAFGVTGLCALLTAAFVPAGPAGAGKPLRPIAEQETMTLRNVNDMTARPTDGAIPPIDAAVHVGAETATFALG